MHFDYNPNARTAAPASATTTRLLCSFAPPAIYSDGTVSALGVTATALLVGLIDVLVDRVVSDFSIVADVPDDRTIVDVAVAWTTVRVMVVVEASDSVVSCAKTEGVRMKASVASVIAKRIFKESMAQSV